MHIEQKQKGNYKMNKEVFKSKIINQVVDRNPSFMRLLMSPYDNSDYYNVTDLTASEFKMDIKFEYDLKSDIFQIRFTELDAEQYDERLMSPVDISKKNIMTYAEENMGVVNDKFFLEMKQSVIYQENYEFKISIKENALLSQTFIELDLKTGNLTAPSFNSLCHFYQYVAKVKKMHIYSYYETKINDEIVRSAKAIASDLPMCQKLVRLLEKNLADTRAGKPYGVSGIFTHLLVELNREFKK